MDQTQDQQQEQTIEPTIVSANEVVQQKESIGEKIYKMGVGKFAVCLLLVITILCLLSFNLGWKWGVTQASNYYVPMINDFTKKYVIPQWEDANKQYYDNLTAQLQEINWSTIKR